MNQPIVRKTKWFWPWQDEQEETWLELMSQQGLHLNQTHIPVTYDFIQGPPQNYTYRLDFQDSMKPKNKDEYLRLFIDAGWEHLGQMGGWQYFRKLSQPGEEREIFTDSGTKIQKYNRFLNWFGLAFPSYLIIFVAIWSNYPEWLMWLNVGIILAFAILWAVISLKVAQRIKQLKAL